MLRDSRRQQARQGVQVKLLAEDNELYIFAESADRVTKERAMRRRQMKWLWKRLRELIAMEISREEMLMKVGAARSRAPTTSRNVHPPGFKRSHTVERGGCRSGGTRC
ncbi:MAG TPA: hypothetical protein VHZ99_01705 [Steroidobacteraceae bacterium]|jgi:hypothetical protein|nr:hypothetical protein [Steroidobacteraceae bacterium]